MRRRELAIKWTVRDVVQPGAVAYQAAPLRGPEDLVAYLAPWAREAQEVLVVIAVNARMKIIGHKEVGRGTSSSCPIDGPSVFRAALMSGGAMFIVAHNHPSGDPTPSPEDVEATQQLVAGAKAIDLPLLDHIVTAIDESDRVIYQSMKTLGLMQEATTR